MNQPGIVLLFTFTSLINLLEKVDGRYAVQECDATMLPIDILHGPKKTMRYTYKMDGAIIAMA